MKKTPGDPRLRLLDERPDAFLPIFFIQRHDHVKTLKILRVGTSALGEKS
jgi:hypothetical protein